MEWVISYPFGRPEGNDIPDPRKRIISIYFDSLFY